MIVRAVVLVVLVVALGLMGVAYDLDLMQVEYSPTWKPQLGIAWTYCLAPICFGICAGAQFWMVFVFVTFTNVCRDCLANLERKVNDMNVRFFSYSHVRQTCRKHLK